MHLAVVIQHRVSTSKAKKFVKVLLNDIEMREEIKCFYLDNVNKSDLINAGTKFTKFVYGAKKTNNDSLNKFRYNYFMKSSL